VVVLDDLSTGREENVEPFRGRIRFLLGSVVDPAVCAEAMEGVDFVLHQAALGSVPRSIADPASTHRANATGTLNVLVAARDAKVQRVVYAASSSAYGNTEELPKREEMYPRPRSPYSVAKLSGEQYCAAFHAAYGLPTVALRYFNVFGPRQDVTSQYAAVIPRFMTAALSGTPPTIYGDGEQSRDFTFVANVVAANLLACAAPEEALGRVFNVGCGERISINRLWAEIRDLAGASVDPAYDDSRTGDVRDSLASLDRIRETLGYEPRVKLREGLEATLGWFQAEASLVG
jgi:nucleoside-diphosphate-sugar epimerase